MEQHNMFKILTPEEYAKVYTTFKRSSQQDDIVRNAITKFILDEHGSKSIDVMSIGPGTGWLEDDLIRHPDLKIKSLLAIEPNSCHVEKLKEKSLNWNETTVEVDSSGFDVDYSTEKRFDIIMAIHSIYYNKDPIDAVIEAKSFLKQGGKLLIFVQGGQGGYELAITVFEQVRRTAPSPSSYYCIYAGLVIEGLKANNIKFTIREFADFLDITDFIERKKTPTCSDTISLFLHTKYEDLDDEIKEDIYNKAKKRTTITENNRYMYGHCNNFIIVE